MNALKSVARTQRVKQFTNLSQLNFHPPYQVKIANSVKCEMTHLQILMFKLSQFTFHSQ